MAPSNRQGGSRSVDRIPHALAPARNTHRPKRLSTVVSEELIRRIISSEYPIGSLLPPEPQLVAEFEVSRPVAREAMKFLEAAGLVAIKQGEGTIVRESSKWNYLEPSVLRSALGSDVGARMRADAVQLRVQLELTLLEEAAPKLTDEDFATMERHLRTMDAATSYDELADADFGFHEVYQSRAGNRLTEGIVHLLVEEMPQPEQVATDLRSSYDQANQKHWAVFHGLRDGDLDAAREALRDLISQMWTWPSPDEAPPG